MLNRTCRGSRTAAGTVAFAAAAAAVLSAASCDYPAAGGATATPIKHVVVIFQENVSFDHYFGTYPHAANSDGEPPFMPPGRHPVGERADHALC